MKTKTYQYVLDATYRFFTMRLNGTLERIETKVKVLGENEKSYKIKLLQPIRSHYVGDEILVRKKNIILHTPNPNYEREEQWWDKD